MGWWQRYLDWRHRHVHALERTADGFRLRAGQASKDMTWTGIQQITAFKRDLLTTDLLCMLIEADEGLVEIDEGMEGYAAIEAAMMHRFGITAEWRLNVLFPAFEANPTLVFRRTPL